ncbi:uncharacterized protein TRIADDRAFT_22398 [Trichoplax adhaerens]|uniref:ATP-citrate synthase n=1 Tax=Trichoplax adhaerens TaxID=10228 RepID=B3RQH9_TRIAD|nr:hypothetical protein TRIADDRAFT_22398 [Trichoplax adhaerens]EDV27248.1 hypothetical protein TRIADDRAFT_22398 [Trichoplax adhaerens]|eukprot:XP_002111244.1 hypothetical protein TRIADDRAFT_22398 [Trichoplax adhaerens]
MSVKAIYEADGKRLISQHLQFPQLAPIKSAVAASNLDCAKLQDESSWLSSERLVVKPDQLIKRRGKLGLIKVNADWPEVQKWITERMNKPIQVSGATGTLRRFIVEPFVKHTQDQELYLCIYGTREGDSILFYHEGGVDVGNVDEKALKLDIAANKLPSIDQVEKELVKNVAAPIKRLVAEFIVALFNIYRKLYFAYLEINPLVVVDNAIYILDLAAKIDATAEYLCKKEWGEITFPPPFGRDAYPEEAYIAELDAKSGASLKLTILNEQGRVWTMVAGGGASVIYSDTICDLGFSHELANYGEYSGAPTESQTYEYAKVVLSLICRHKHPEGKVLIIGGGIANFTNVAATFKGIIRALMEFRHLLVESKVSIFARRGGPNYQEGLRMMRDLGTDLGVPLHVFGPETHMTAIVSMALGKQAVSDYTATVANTQTVSLLLGESSSTVSNKKSRTSSFGEALSDNKDVKSLRNERGRITVFTDKTRCFVWGMQPRAVQGMLDFDYVSSRETWSVAAMIYPFSGDHKQKFYWGHKEILIPVFKDMSDAMRKFPEVDVLVNFASLRSAYDSTMEALQFKQIKAISIIAEGIPEAKTKQLIATAQEKDVTVIGPATVGGIKPGCFRIGNTGGMLDNIIASKLYRPGSVAYVSRSGGMSNELNNMICRTTDGVYEGVAIGGDRYPGTTFIDHILRYNDTDDVKLIVMLGEVGGIEEYHICQEIKNGRITKPVVAWCIGTCASMFTSEVQFGHAGACANADRETSVAKNKALREAGAHVPNSFDDYGILIRDVYNDLVSKGTIVPKPEQQPPTVPMDYAWARELGLIRKPSSFMTTICDERGDELRYAGMPISEIFKEEMGIGGVIGLLWFQRRLPHYATRFIEMCLILTADHGPAVSGAHNTIVTARAGKDLISSLTSGLLTIGDRFGGALDGAARQFSEAFDLGLLPMEFVNSMRKQNKLIMGIGHRVKSLNNPDKRVVILKHYVKSNFPSTPLLDYAIEVEKITTSKRPNLILNVDGCIGVCFVDLLRNCGAFTTEEVTEYIESGTLNGIFVLGRSMGFIGHFLDQKRLKQGLYRHPWDDISYIMPEGLDDV